MQVVKPGTRILTPVSKGGIKELQHLERIARVCYQSEDHITKDGESAKKLIRALIKSGHEAMLEHGSVSVWFRCDRGISHELVRHRVASFAQESTRYCNYSKGKFGSELTFIRPFFFENTWRYNAWLNQMQEAENTYLELVNNGAKPEEARSVLPNSLKTSIVVTANYREWRHIFNLRCSPNAHPQMRELMLPLLDQFNARYPVLFEDIYEKYKDQIPPDSRHRSIG